MPGMTAVVMNDQVTGLCAGHQIPSPSGAPMPSPAPLPFSAPLNLGLATKVNAGGKAMAVVGSNGLNKPPHPGLHATDLAPPPQQKGQITGGSSKVYIQGKAAAYTGCQTSVCFGAPGMVTGTAAKVSIAP